MTALHSTQQHLVQRISFIGARNLLAVKDDICSRIVSRQKVHSINRLPISSRRPLSNLVNGPDIPNYSAKEVSLNAQECSATFLDYHQAKYWIILSGIAWVSVGEQNKMLNPHQSIFIPLMTRNTIKNIGSGDLVIVEFRARLGLSGNEIIEFDNELASAPIAI